MNKVFKPAGTVLFGRAMLAQLASEMALLNVKYPVVVTLPDTMKKAVRAAGKLAPGFISSLPVTSGDPPEECDFLILAGGRALADRYAVDSRPKALVPLTDRHLAEIDGPVSDFLVADSGFIRDRKIMETFLRNYAFAVSDGLAQIPGNLKIPPAFTYSCRTAVHSGDEALSELPRLLREQGVTRPLVLTDKGIVAVGLLEKLTEVTGGFDIEVFDDIPPDSNSRVVNRISRLYREKDRDGLIAFGGGSVLDTGKGVYLNVSLQADDLGEWAGSNRIPRLTTPFIAVPTTSGTGSEVTKAAVISDEDRGRKVLFISSNLQPDHGILDSRLTASLPPHLTSITGMDALSHAVEAFTCLGKNPLSDQMAWKAVELIRDHLLPCMDDPQDLEHRRGLALASNLAGQAFSNSMVGMVHTVGHSVGGVCHVPHGSCMSILLPPSLEYNYEKIEPLLAELLPALAGQETADATAAPEKARKAIETIREMNRILKEKTGGRHPERFSEVVTREGKPLVEKSDFQEIARTALGDGSIVYNPEELRFEDILRVLEECY